MAATNYKSMAAASGMNDIFTKLGWHYTAYPDAHPGTICIQYKSHALGMVRSVHADPLNLARRLQDHRAAACGSGVASELQPGMRAEFERILDRKPERAARPVQQELELGAMPPIVKESMGE